jgi:hypothetical protein
VMQNRFRVTCFEAGKWDGAEAREVEARDEKEAAEHVCGGPLEAAGKPGQLRAQVSPVGEPAARSMFYRPA